MSSSSAVRLPRRRAPLAAPRPWVLRALVLTAVYGVVQTAFVALRSLVPDLLTLWSVLLLAVVLAVGILWAGAEVVLDRRPPEWTWFGAALAAGPGAGLLSWILLALLVDDTGVADLQPALVGRASFTVLLILASVFVGSRLGWLSLRRHGEGADDPALDADDEAVAREAAVARSGALSPSTPPRRATRAPREPPPSPVAAGPTVSGVRTPSPRVRDRAPEIAERDRMPEAPRLAAERRASRVRTGVDSPAGEPPVSPFGPGERAVAEDRATPESLAPPVVAVLPTSEIPVQPAPAPDPGPAERSAVRRRFGLRRPITPRRSARPEDG